MSTTTLKSFCQGAEQLLSVEANITQQPRDEAMAKNFALWKKGMFRIVVMGEIKKGKSSFVNALLRTENLVPVCDDVATSTVFKICYGPELEYRVFFSKESGKPVQTIQPSEVADYGTENGNPENKKEVDFILVTLPSPMLKDGLVVIDTPGLGGVIKNHKKITYEYVPKADAVFVVTESCGAPLGALEIALINDLKKVTKHIYFVQTKSSMVSGNECVMRKDRNTRILTESAGLAPNDIQYFIVDSALKTLADEDNDRQKLEESGFDKVAAFVNQYIRTNVQRLILERASAVIKPKVDVLCRTVAERARVYAAQTDEARGRLKLELEEAQAQIEAWERDVLPPLQSDFDQGLQAVQDEALLILEQSQPQSGFHLELMERIDAATDIEEVKQIADQCNDKLPEFFTEIGNKITAKVTDGFKACIGKFVLKCLPDGCESQTQVLKQDPQASFVAAGGVGGDIDRFETKGVFDAARTAFYGWAAGTAIGTYVGGAIGSIVPVVGTAIGATVGACIAGLWGAKQSINISRSNQLAGAKSSLKGSITSWMNINCNKLHSRLNMLLSNLRLATSSQVRAVISAVRKEFNDNIKRLSKTGKENLAELQREQNEFAVQQALLTGALTQMGLLSK